MIDLPATLLEGQFNKFIKRGCIISFHAEDLNDPDHPEGKRKFAIILNPICPAALIFYVFATSKVGYYDANPQFESSIIRIEPGAYYFFPLATVIPFTRVHAIPIDQLKAQYKVGRLAFPGALSDTDMKRVDETIAKSRLLSGRTKKLILPKTTAEGLSP